MRRSVLVMALIVVCIFLGLGTKIIGTYLGLNAKSHFARLDLLKAAESAYKTNEAAHGIRGPLFYNFVGEIVLARMNDSAAFSAADIERGLGKPDATDLSSEGSTLLYRCNRFGTADWTVIIDVNKKGEVTQIGFNASSAFD